MVVAALPAGRGCIRHLPTSVHTDDARGSVATVTVAAIMAQVATVLVLVVFTAMTGGAVGDRAGAIPLGVVYVLPAVLAILAMRGRSPLLLAAGVASLALAVLPVSLHSVVYGPAGVIYLVAHARRSAAGRGDARSVVAAVVVPGLVVAAVLALTVHEDPICYTRDASGRVTIDRDPGDVGSGFHEIDAGSDIVEWGCSSDTVVWWEALLSLALSTGAVVLAVGLVRGEQPEP